jgi:N utilization substance protein A
MQQGGLTLQHVIEQVSQEKGIDPTVLVEAMEQAILTAAKRTFGMNRDLRAAFNQETGAVDLFQTMIVRDDVADPETEISLEDARRYGLDSDPENPLAEGEELDFQIFYMPEDAEKARQQDKEFGDLLLMQQHRRGFGRIAAQTAKQVIIQRVRDAERERVFNEFKDRRGEIVTGVVRRFERGNNIIVDLRHNVEAVLPPKEQTPRESYRPGDRIVALLKDIDREARGPQIILSRTDVGLLVKLFEMEVPEIYEGIVRIVAASREPGARSKIAVSSRDSDVDPVGACVGMKGSRVQAVVQELRGEKIDIVPWDRDPARFVCNAIAPAEVVRVVIDDAHGSMELVVPDAKLSLAIGRRGQNVRLASQLTGWKLDIVSESRFKEMEEEAMSALARIAWTDEELPRSLYKMGFRSLDEVAEAPEAELSQVHGVGEGKAGDVKVRALEALEAFRKERLAGLAHSAEPLTERERLLLVRGVSERVADMLEHAGYRSVEDIYREEDSDRLAIKTGLGSQRATYVKDAVVEFVENEWPPVELGRKKARAAADAEQKRADAQAASEREAEAETVTAESSPE